MTNDLKPRILIIDDEAQMRKLLSLTLGPDFKVLEAVNGNEGSTHAATDRPDLVILDLGLPDIGGLEVLKRIRDWSDIPIIVLSALDDPETISEALDHGADDYMTKPFEARELKARIKVCLRRAIKKEHESNVVEARGIRLDLTLRMVWKDESEIKLTSTEYDLLKFLMTNSNKVLTNRQILKEVWGPLSLENVQYPRVYIRHLRQKLESNPDEPKLIRTVPGVGYRLTTKD